MKVVVFDIDGTLADVEHRRQYVATRPRNWKAFEAGIPHDKPHEDIVELARLFHHRGFVVVLCSGRNEHTRSVTEQQMEQFGVEYQKLYMRKTGDHRDDGIVKVELMQQISTDYDRPWLWFDDRQRVVDAIRSYGIRVLQVAPGDF